MKTLAKSAAKGMILSSLLLLAFQAVRTNGAEVWLQAEQFTKTMPDSTVITMWGFRLMDANWVPLAGQLAQAPGPRLTIPPGESLTIHLKNTLATEPVSIVIPGQAATMPAVKFGPTDPYYPDRVRSFTNEAAPGGGTSDYTWQNLKEGTYLYHSGTHPQVQVQMGLYGAVTKDYAAGLAYSGVSYTKDVLLLYSEIDPSLHAAVAGGNYGPGLAITSTMKYEPKFFLVNGAAYPDLIPGLPALAADDQVLFRFLNAGLKTHIPLLQGLYVNLVAEDGSKGLGPGGASPPYPKPSYSVFLAAGQTADATLIQPAQPGPCNFAIYDRALHLTNAAATNGGMYTFVTLTPTGAIPPRVDDTLTVTKDSAGNLQFKWNDLPGSFYYRIYESVSVGPTLPPFSSLTGGSGSGTTGVLVAMPTADLVFYQVAAVTTCGTLEGPQN